MPPPDVDAATGGAPIPLLTLGRLTHHRHIVETGNDSYRVTQASANSKRRIKARETERKADTISPAQPPAGPPA